MAIVPDQSILDALRGYPVESSKQPTPRLVKIYISSTKHEFKEERKVLLEVIGPELQSIYDDRQIEIEFVDMHFGTGLLHTSIDLDPYVVYDHLNEIKTCQRASRSIYFISLIGNSLGEFCLPIEIQSDVYNELINLLTSDETELIKNCYRSDSSNGSIYFLLTNFRNLKSDEWIARSGKLRSILESKFEILYRTTQNESVWNALQIYRERVIEKEIKIALDTSTEKMLVVFRNWKNKQISNDVERLRNNLIEKLSNDNHFSLTVEHAGNGCDNVDPEGNEAHEEYLAAFKRSLIEKLRVSIDKDLKYDPDGGKGKRKTVQEIFYEHSVHLAFLNEHLMSKSFISSAVPEKMENHIKLNYRNGARHAPYFIYGPHGSGKSSLMSRLYTECLNWFTSPNVKVHRLIRFSKATPRSAYNLELLRVICQQISIILNIPEGYLPKDASFDPLYINNWFQNLLKRTEDMNNEVLFIFLDDLHKINPLDCDIVAALSWLPISLPWNVFLVCSTTSMDSLKLSPIQRERFKNGEFLYDLTSPQCDLKIIREVENETFSEFLNRYFDDLEERYGTKGIAKFSTYLNCTEYGLTETEFLELLMPTHDLDATLEPHCGEFNFSSFCSIRNDMRPLIREKLMSGKLLIEWRHDLCAEITKKRYISDQESLRLAHAEIVNLFFPQETSDESDEINTDNSDKSPNTKPKHCDETSTISTQQPIPGSDITYSIRHVEESWHHLIKSDDNKKLKEIAVCNFDFLLAAVQTVSISYLRCLIEHVRCYILDRDIELVYYTIRKASDVLTRDPMQLGAQLISWLRTVSTYEGENSLLGITVQSAIAWCDGLSGVPLLVPLTGWLPVPLPSQIRCMTVPGGAISQFEVSPCKQYLILAKKTGDPQLWHIMSNTLVGTFKGHSGAITCMMVPKNTHDLVTGSEDTSVIIWDIKTQVLKTRLWLHIAAVLCVTSAMNNSLIVSGSDDSSIIISSYLTGKSVMKIDHHRGPVVYVAISSTSEVLVSGSHDATICLWSLETYELLNLMQFNAPVLNFRLSPDSVFLLAHCEDNGLYLRTLATGTELHQLKGHKSKVLAFSIAADSQRAIVGCDDTKAYIFDMCSGKIIRTMPPNPGTVSAVFIMDKDDYLITAGGNKITFYSFRNEDSIVNYYPKKKEKRKHRKQLVSANRLNLNSNNHPICCFDISRDSTMAAVAIQRSIQIWTVQNNPELSKTFEGHTATITCISFAPNCELLVTASDDRTAIVWGLQFGILQTTFKAHNAAITCLTVLMDSIRIITSDREGFSHVWLADSGTILQTVQGPHKYLAVTNNMKFAMSTNGDNSLRIWSLTREDEKYHVSHTDEITCFVITADSLHVITGSRDMSLKVWQSTGGKLAQVLVGHSDAVLAVAVSAFNKSHVISGSKDCNLILWDLHTGEEIHTLAGHLGPVTCVKVSADGTTAVSGSDDKTIIVWETARGLALTSLQLHVQFTRFDISLECSRILVHLTDNPSFPIICLHNSPAQYIKLPTYSAPARDVEDLRPAAAKRPARRLLKKELSLDTYSWQKKYAHLTSTTMMAQVDERLKRRFSVSTSMEEISKIAEMKNIGSQQNIGNPEQAALAQSQHFDQLEALWNKRSPPRRRINQSLSRQSSLAEDRINSSDEDEFLEERSGTCFNYFSETTTQTNSNARACNKDTCFEKSRHQNGTSSCLSLESNQPDLLKEVLARSKASIKVSQTENDLKRLDSSSFDVTKSESFNCLRSSNCRRTRKLKFPSDSINLTKTNDDDASATYVIHKSKKRRNPLARSCISQ
ncbi:hypothetical protein PVAND_008347 [Polypedilum vanderplanki]|uniref:NWD1/2-like winged helix-turn-helix domain-containing protein n=1 Tax=Polypedilum vanderplanki TaxID=319348 RepID=A0A9J6CAB3_POLVA|nr:hypothetical protein PVAND_008347 [Polypedilum vanderplanki]